MQTRIGENGLAVDVEGICLPMIGVRHERVTPSDPKVFCFSLAGGVERFGYGGRIIQFENVDYAERGDFSVFNSLEDKAYDIIALDLTFDSLDRRKAIDGVRKAIERVIFARFKGLYGGRSAPTFSIAGEVDVAHFNREYIKKYKRGEADCAYGAYGFRFVKGSRKENVFDLGL